MSQNPNFDKLIRLLKELFQLDQPDLDFGLYRIMHARAAEISQFLDRDLLPQVKEAFGQYQTADKAELEKELQQAIEQANGLGVDPETAAKVKELRQKIAEQGVDVTGLEQEVYDHLYKFFRRYYHEGDFLAKHVYKPGVYAIPYEGEEVKLHWANKDQYYIKSSEYLRDYAFILKPGAADPMRVHLRLVDAAEGEHGNVKEAEGKNRVFILAGEDSIAEEDGASGKELVICFEYRPATLADWNEDAKANATAAAKKKPPTQKDLRDDAVRRLLAVEDENLKPWLAELDKKHIKADGGQADYSRLAAHLNRYTARNTFDYFIHKDLGGFLRRELDFYIKNEVMHLDDIESETAPRVEQYLSKIKVIRQIAGKLIDFLAQLEGFQKKLWLKKKFVTETSWCIRVGCIPEELYPEIAANEAQRQEWVELHAIDEIEADLTTVAYSEPLTVDFLKAHPTLMVDTLDFDESFSQRLLEAMGDIDEQTDGVLFHGDNFQALSLLKSRYDSKVSGIYVDPPYNTGDDGFCYKDSYKSSSWLSMISDRLDKSIALLNRNGVAFVSIGDEEQDHLSVYCRNTFGKQRHFATLVWEKKKKGSFLSGNIAKMKDYVLCLSKDYDSFEGLIGEISSDTETYPCVNASNPRETRVFKKGLRSKYREKVANLSAGSVISAGNMNLILQSDLKLEDALLKEDVVVEGNWRYSQQRLDEFMSNSEIYITQDLYFRRIVNEPRYKRLKDILSRVGSGGEGNFRSYDVNNLNRYGWGSNEDANDELHQILGSQYATSYPKPAKLVTLLMASTRKSESVWLDCFAGSGTTGHAVINLNREDGGQRKFIMVELGEYFDTVLLPRLKKVTFTPEWKAGKPKRFATEEEVEHSPRIMKVIRLESYEDALNNLEPRRSETQTDLLTSQEAQGTDGLREQYLLRYWLDVETRGSQSLLNIGAFTDPTAYKLKVKRPGSEETREVNVDLLETFNWLIGLTVESLAAPQTVTAQFERDDDPDLPEDNPRRLLLDGRVREAEDGPWWFRTVTGTTPDGRKTLVIWRKITGDPEEDNLVLDEWFKKQGYSSKDSEFDLIYVNGDNNLENLRQPDDTWKVRLIEEDFHRLMFEEAEA